MLAPVRERHDHEPPSKRGDEARPPRMIEPTGHYRTNSDIEPVMPLPRWASWALVGWMIGSATVYTAILARWWE
jgi:hypothetical protein